MLKFPPGHQFKVSVLLSKNTERTRGDMQLSIFTKSETVNFKLNSEYVFVKIQANL